MGHFHSHAWFDVCWQRYSSSYLDGREYFQEGKESKDDSALVSNAGIKPYLC